MLLSRENPLGGIIRLLLLCLVVGLVLAFFDIRPQNILTDTLRTVTQIWDLLTGVVGWAVPYVLMGAVIVVPVVVISAVTRARRRP